MAVIIELTQGRVTYVDKINYKWLNEHKWFVHKDNKNGYFYARRQLTVRDKQKTLLMHREIMKHKYPLLVFDGMHIDHINRNSLDNRESNLRICTNQENQLNRRHNKTTLPV